MRQRLKRILLIVLFAASVIAIGAALYFMFFVPAKPPAGVPPVGEVELPPGVLPTAEEGRPPTAGEAGAGALPEAAEVASGGLTKTTTLTLTGVTDVSLSANGQGMNYYSPSDGRFYSINEDGEAVSLSEAKFPDVENVEWNKDANKAVLEFPDGTNIVYDFDSEIQVTLPKHWEDFGFSPTRDEIVAKSIGIDPGNRALVVVSDDGSRAQAVAALGQNEDKVEVSPSPDDQVIAFSDTGDPQSGFGRRMIIPVGKNEENFQGLIVEGFGFRPLWSPRGDLLVYSVAGALSDYKPALWAVNGTPANIGDGRRSVGLNTWADKCAFADNSIMYCAVPNTLPDNAGLQTALAAGIPDNVWRVDLSTGRTELVAIPENGASMESPRVSEDCSLFYYANALTGRLEMIKLK